MDRIIAPFPPIQNGIGMVPYYILKPTIQVQIGLGFALIMPRGFGGICLQVVCGLGGPRVTCGLGDLAELRLRWTW